jgi:TolB protein
MQPSSGVTVLPGTRGGTQPRLAPDGSRIAFQSVHGDLWVMERASGSVGPLLTTGEASFNPAWSPDGNLVAYSCIKNGRSALWLAGADGSDPRRLTECDCNCFQPVWHPSSRYLLFISDRDGTEDLYRLAIDSGEMTRLGFDGAANPALAPDGTRVVYGVPKADGPVMRVAVLDPEVTSLAVVWERPVEVNRWAGAKARFGPDGHWIAYDQPAGAIGGDIFALPVTGGADETPVRLTALPFPASLTGWFDWCGDDRLVVAVARSSLRLLLVENADQWVSRALSDLPPAAPAPRW